MMTDLEFIFHPESIAIVGAPRDPADVAGGSNFLHALINSGYGGRIYPVNPRAAEIMGFKCYPDIASLPEAPDYVISCIPAAATPQLVRDCTARGVKVISLYTAGFSEACDGSDQLERQLLQLAREGGTRLIGPNCLGIYCPEAGISFQTGQSSEPGHIGLLCQSGGNSNILALAGYDRGLRFSKIVSYGNAVDLNEADFLDYLAADSQTQVIAVYIEGPRAGTGFLRSLAAAARTKPVILLKGGYTEAGARAAASHTGSLAGSRNRWEALCRQADAIQVNSLAEMLDVLTAVLHLERARGFRTGIVGWGGGASVAGTDACDNCGLTVPVFSEKLQQELKQFAFGPGMSVANPIDSAIVTDPAHLTRALRTVSESGEVDLILLHLPLDVPHTVGPIPIWESAREAVIEASGALDVPIVIVQPFTAHPDSSGIYYSLQQRCAVAGLPLYADMRDAAMAARRVIECQMRRDSPQYRSLFS